MNKLYKLSAFYAVLGMAGGVFFREFTKLQGFDGVTSLGVVHTHAFMLGMMFFLVVLILEKLFALSTQKNFLRFLYIYNIGLLIAIVMLFARGIPQVLNITLASRMNSAISGIAGIGHILICIGLFYFFKILKHQTKQA
ncbi:DUF2871 domain-containing protein [Amedibacillus sp. YH-ame6]